jgi:putative tricarboxylic transport membrane protein
MGRDKSNLIAAASLAVFGIYVVYGGSKLSYVSDVGPGPGFFPFWIGIGFLLFGAYQMVLSYSSARRHADHVVTIWSGAGRALGAWLGLALAIALFRWMGFVLSFILLTIFLIVVLDRRPALSALGIGAGLALAFYLLFEVALGVSLPAGPWGF